VVTVVIDVNNQPDLSLRNCRHRTPARTCKHNRTWNAPI